MGGIRGTRAAHAAPLSQLRLNPKLQQTGILAFIAVKAAVLFAAGPSLGLSRAEAAKVAILLAGGGEYAAQITNQGDTFGRSFSKLYFEVIQHAGPKTPINPSTCAGLRSWSSSWRRTWACCQTSFSR